VLVVESLDAQVANLAAAPHQWQFRRRGSFETSTSWRTRISGRSRRPRDTGSTPTSIPFGRDYAVTIP
jgi:hypothetical protein